MTIDHGVATDDFWGDSALHGSSATWVFEGQDGLDRLSGSTTFSSSDPSRFRARLTHVQIDHIALEGFAATPYRSSRTASHISTDTTPMVTFVFLKSGTLRFELADTAFEVAPETFAIIDSRDPVAVTASTDVRMLASVVALEHLPKHLRGRGTTIAAPLPRTPLADNFVAFQASVLTASLRGRPPEGDHFIRATVELHASVLAEAQQLSSAPQGATALRQRMEAYIGQHFAEADLRPETVADAVGVSLRHAHAVFNEGDRTIGRSIRERRTEALAFTLRTTTQHPSASELAAQHGFSSAESMGRAFKERYGVSPNTYRSTRHRPLG